MVTNGHQSVDTNYFKLVIFKIWWVQQRLVSPNVQNKNGKYDGGILVNLE